jgi:hypothetical protein
LIRTLEWLLLLLRRADGLWGAEQNDKRCLFGSTVLTTNEESYFLKDVHKVRGNFTYFFRSHTGAY